MGCWFTIVSVFTWIALLPSGGLGGLWFRAYASYINVVRFPHDNLRTVKMFTERNRLRIICKPDEILT